MSDSNNNDVMQLNPEADYLSLYDAATIRIDSVSRIASSLILDDRYHDLVGTADVMARQLNEAHSMIEKMSDLYEAECDKSAKEVSHV